MKLILSPQRRDDTLSVIVSGDILILNGEVLNFGPLPEGGTLPSSATGSPWLLDDVHRINGQIELTLIMPHGANASEAARFPEPLIVSEDGPVELPV
ncbi:hypothetical protein D3C75_619530 [compost metagenome]